MWSADECGTGGLPDRTQHGMCLAGVVAQDADDEDARDAGGGRLVGAGECLSHIGEQLRGHLPGDDRDEVGERRAMTQSPWCAKDQPARVEGQSFIEQEPVLAPDLEVLAEATTPVRLARRRATQAEDIPTKVRRVLLEDDAGLDRARRCRRRR